MASSVAPSQSEVERAFAEEMQRFGFTPGPIRADTDKYIRFDAPGDKKGKGNGYYKLKTGLYPAGWFGDWKSPDIVNKWFFRDPNRGPETEADRKRRLAEQKRIKAETDRERAIKHAEIAEKASRMWSKSSSEIGGHPYLVGKQIANPRGLRIYTAKDGTQLLAVPMYAVDIGGKQKLMNLQLIDGEGRKRFLEAGRVEGCFFTVKGEGTAYVICEGYATGQIVWEATGATVVAAFNAGNLIEVVKAVALQRPSASILIAADNDAIAPADWPEKGGGRPWVNAGVKKAEAAAKAVACRWVYPVFKKGERYGFTDFSDLHLEEGLDTVRAQIEGAFKSRDAEDLGPGADVVQLPTQDESWRQQVPRTSAGAQDGANVEGVATYIANHRLLRDRLRFNQLTKEMEIDGNSLEDHHVAEFRRIMHHDGLKARKSDVQDEMEAEARRNAFDPLTEYLGALDWDQTPRLDTWLHDYLGAPANAYTRDVGRKALIGAVARALDPGCKNDSMMVLEGDQGTGKSTAIRYLFGDRFFIDHLPDFHSKDSFQQLQGAWCVEVAELSALTKADVKDVKQYLSRMEDKFRPPYGRNTIHVKRRTVFVGTVNPEAGQGYLKDPTGGRRFWPVVTTTIALASILLDRDQLWAEAVQAFKNRERWHLEDEEAIATAKEQQELRREVDPWEDPIRLWLVGHGRCTIAEVYEHAIKMTADKQSPQFSRRIGNCLRACGWIDKRERPGPGQPTTQVFYSPAEMDMRRKAAEIDFTKIPIPGAIGPQDDVPY